MRQQWTHQHPHPLYQRRVGLDVRRRQANVLPAGSDDRHCGDLRRVQELNVRKGGRPSEQDFDRNETAHWAPRVAVHDNLSRGGVGPHCHVFQGHRFTRHSRSSKRGVELVRSSRDPSRLSPDGHHPALSRGPVGQVPLDSVEEGVPVVVAQAADGGPDRPRVLRKGESRPPRETRARPRRSPLWPLARVHEAEP